MRHSVRLTTLAVLAAFGMACVLRLHAAAPVTVYNGGLPDENPSGGKNITGSFTVADHFTFTSTTTFDTVQFWEDEVATDTSAINWTVYADSSGKPGIVLFSGSVPTPTRTATGNTLNNGGTIYTEFKNTFSTGSLTLNAGTYWLGLYEPTNNGTAEYWASSAGNPATPGANSERMNVTTQSGFVDTGTHQAFQLLSSSPEPSQAIALGIGILLLSLLLLRVRKMKA